MNKSRGIHNVGIVHKLGSKLLVSAAIVGIIGGISPSGNLKKATSLQTVQAAKIKSAKLTRKTRIYNKKGQLYSRTTLQKGKYIRVTNTRYIKSHKYYGIGKGRYVVASNVKLIRSSESTTASLPKTKLYKVGESGDCNLTYSPVTKTLHISAYGDKNTLADSSLADKVNGAKIGKGRHLAISEIEHISIDTNISLGDYDAYIDDEYGAFANFANLRDITGLNKVYAGSCGNLNSMFANNPKLERLDLSSWDTYKLAHGEDTSTANMFFGDSGLTELNLTGWDISNVYNTKGMFDGVNSSVIKGLIQNTKSYNDEN